MPIVAEKRPALQLAASNSGNHFNRRQNALSLADKIFVDKFDYANSLNVSDAALSI